MGTRITLNDTLQITKEQGFPTELNFAVHQTNPMKAEDFQNRIFEFHDKEDLRAYQAPPVRVFLVENIDGKWLYWGQCHVLETTQDLEMKTTSGKFKITKIFTPEEMKIAFELIDSRSDMNYLK